MIGYYGVSFEWRDYNPARARTMHEELHGRVRWGYATIQACGDRLAGALIRHRLEGDGRPGVVIRTVVKLED